MSSAGAVLRSMWAFFPVLLCACHGVPVETVRHLCEAAKVSGQVLTGAALVLASQLEATARARCSLCSTSDDPARCCDAMIDQAAGEISETYAVIEQAGDAQRELTDALAAVKACKVSERGAP